MHLAITGNIGAGKTTLAALLGQHFGWEVFYEAVEDNPYLKDFYDDMPRWAFHTQVFFLNSRFNQVHQISQREHSVIQDRTIYEDAYIFATNLYTTGIMPRRDFDNYMALFQSVSSLVRPPDLMIYLKADLPKLTQQIRLRNRDYERNLNEDYLQSLNEHYENWTQQYDLGKLLVVDSNELDFLNNPAHLNTLISEVKAALPMGEPGQLKGVKETGDRKMDGIGP
jgi:deoxyadenosine/deoxycytidine kinase